MRHHRLTLAFLLATSLAATAQTALIAANTLPEAPTPQRGGPKLETYAPTVMVNGNPYRFPTPKEQFQVYEHELLSTRSVFHAAIRAGFEQIKPTPAGWGQDFPGYMQRFGDAYGEAAISSTVRYGLSSTFHEDNRYLICHQCSAGAKLANAALAEFTARHGADGHRAFSPTPIAASLSGPLIGYAVWYPAGDNTSKLALRHVVFNVSTRFAFNAAREFLFDRDSKRKGGQKVHQAP